MYIVVNNLDWSLQDNVWLLGNSIWLLSNSVWLLGNDAILLETVQWLCWNEKKVFCMLLQSIFQIVRELQFELMCALAIFNQQKKLCQLSTCTIAKKHILSFRYSK